ncbi:MAG TPA: hypothetical protein VK338_01615 [Candidatus Nitrosocosmicus sp.]|nr:hypothetical protein [Candidatus Nitrosocosmicus sp.]
MTEHIENKPQTRDFHSFNMYPAVRFETQAVDEIIILMVRAHPITLLPWILVAIFLFILPLIFNLFLASFLSINQLIFVNLFWYTGLFSYVFLNTVSWLFNVGIVTNRRIVDVDFHNIIYKEVTSSTLPKVEDITVKTGGFIRSIFDFGTLFIQTAGTHVNIEFKDIPHPSEASHIINNLMHPEDES